MALQKSTLTFLRTLRKNNDRSWFNDNKSKYQDAHADMIALTEDLLRAYGKVEDLPVQEAKKAVFRIYRDVRFSKNKDPYKTHLAAHIRRQPDTLGLYVHVEPGGKSLVATGIWQPEPATLGAVRQELDYNAAALRKVLARKRFRDTFGELSGDELKTAPKGYEKDNPNIDLIRKKQWMVWKYYKDAEVTDPGFVKQIVSDAKVAKPFMEFFDAVLQEAASKKKK